MPRKYKRMGRLKPKWSDDVHDSEETNGLMKVYMIKRDDVGFV